MTFGTVYSALDLKAKYHIPEYDINGTIEEEYQKCISDLSISKEKLVRLINLASIEYQMIQDNSGKFTTTTEKIISGLYLLLERQVEIEKGQNYYFLLGQIKFDYFINHQKTQFITNPECLIKIEFENPGDNVTFLIENLEGKIIGIKNLSYENEVTSFNYNQLVETLDLENIIKQNNFIEFEQGE